MVIGYVKGWCGLNELVFGEIGLDVFIDNMGEWSGDYMMDYCEVFGVFFISCLFKKFVISLQNFVVLIFCEFGVEEFFFVMQLMF